MKTYSVINHVNDNDSQNVIDRIIGARTQQNQAVIVVVRDFDQFPECLRQFYKKEDFRSHFFEDGHIGMCLGVGSVMEQVKYFRSKSAHIKIHVVYYLVKKPEEGKPIIRFAEAATEHPGQPFGLPLSIGSDTIKCQIRDPNVDIVTLFAEDSK